MQDHQHSEDEEQQHHSHKEPICTTCSLAGTSACETCEHGEACESCGHDHNHDEKVNWKSSIIIGLIIAIGIALDYFALGGPAPRLILIAAMIASGYKMAINGIKGLLKGKIGIDLLVTIAAIGATAIGQYSEGAVVVFLKDISIKLEVVAGERARHAIEALMELRPEVATLKQNGLEIIVPVEKVLPGEVFIVKPGDRIPLDGVVVEGDTSVDQSAMTGESIPVHKTMNDEVFAGTINIDGYLAARTTRGSSESMLSNILRMVQEAEGRRSTTETVVNRFARYYICVCTSTSARRSLDSIHI